MLCLSHAKKMTNRKLLNLNNDVPCFIPTKFEFGYNARPISLQLPINMSKRFRRHNELPLDIRLRGAFKTIFSAAHKNGLLVTIWLLMFLSFVPPYDHQCAKRSGCGYSVGKEQHNVRARTSKSNSRRNSGDSSFLVQIVADKTWINFWIQKPKLSRLIGFSKTTAI